MEKINFFKMVIEAEMEESGKGLTETVEAVAEWVGVGKSAAWSWWTGARSPSAAARKLLRLRADLPQDLREKVELL